ncbi:MAG: DNA replication/repair protein RecF [Clostridiales bacterium]|nr:DNA replication/repair protein RecF [Clostridiales bacterium]
MYISKIYLKNFRNYDEQVIFFNEKVNIIYGKNAQGKTNLLESIFLCSTGRSHRTSKDYELIKEGKNSYSVKIEGVRDDIPFNIGIYFEKDGRKNITINNLKVKKLGELMGVLNTVIFSPEDLQIIKRGPGERRRFLDILICQTHPAYFYKLQTYMRVVKQKNSLLRKFEVKGDNEDLLDVFNIKQAEIGSEIILEREKFISEIKDKLKENHAKLTKSKEEIEIKYISSAGRKCENPNEFMKLLKNNKKKEIRNSACLYGPHRDDLEFFINGSDLKAYGSQGQQRTAVLSLKLTEIDIIREMTGFSPVLLLDDVMSELDISRKRYLLENIKTRQTIITGTEKRSYAAFKNISSFYNVVNGIVEEK